MKSSMIKRLCYLCEASKAWGMDLDRYGTTVPGVDIG